LPKLSSLDIIDADMGFSSFFRCFILLVLFVFQGGCSYTLTSTQGAQVSSAQIQKIKLGRTTEMDLVKLLGPPSKKERLLSGNERLLYESTAVKSLTFPWGYKAKGFFDKEEDEVFEVILKNGIVQSYRYLKPQGESG
jgi:hypothetical protein